MRDRFVARLTRLAKSDPNLMLLTGDLGFGVLTKFQAELPRQFLNVGVAEQNLSGIAAGLALSGKTVYTYSIGNFVSLRCLEQIRNDICYHDLNVKIVCIGGGFSYGALGTSHHATEDLAILRAIPNLQVVSPGCKWEAEEATEAMARESGTFYLRLDKSGPDTTQLPGEKFELGKMRKIRGGQDISIIATGGILECALAASDQLKNEGIQARVYSCHTVKPIDRAAIETACRETGGIVTLEEHTIHGGLGSAVAEVIMDHGLIQGMVKPKIFHRMALREGFSSIVGSQEYLRKRYNLDAGAIQSKIKSLLTETTRFQREEIIYERPLS